MTNAEEAGSSNCFKRSKDQRLEKRDERNLHGQNMSVVIRQTGSVLILPNHTCGVRELRTNVSASYCASFYIIFEGGLGFHSFIKYLHEYFMPVTALGSGNSSVNKMVKTPYPHKT
jgi:hypothetical protein